MVKWSVPPSPLARCSALRILLRVLGDNVSLLCDTMKTVNQTNHNSELAKSLAAEDIQRGDVVAILDMVHELPSFLWNSESHVLSPHEPVCIRLCSPSVGKPLKVKSICLPFVLAETPRGRYRTLDVRRCRLVRLGHDYAEMAWEQFRKAKKNKNK